LVIPGLVQSPYEKYNNLENNVKPTKFDRVINMTKALYAIR